MKIFFYYMRPFDELAMAEQISRELDIPFGWAAEYPTLENAELAAGYDIVSAPPCDMNGKLVERFHELGVRCIACHSIGFDHVDLETARRLGMRVTNVTYPPEGVADYAIMLMLMCLRRMPYILKCTEVQDYALKGKIGRELSGCTVGVIGTGNIGATVIRHLSGFGCRVLAYDIRPRDDLPAAYVSLKELLAQADVITLHAPVNDANAHMIGREAIAGMKRGAVIVNTARGRLIDTEALIEGLVSGQIGAAALDVLEQEGGLYYKDRRYDVIADRQMAMLRAMPNVIVSPHTAFYTETDVYHMVLGNFQTAVCLRDGTEDPHVIL